MKKINCFHLVIIFILAFNFSAFSKSRINISDIVKRYEKSKTPESQAKMLISEKKYKSAHKILIEVLKKDDSNYKAYTMIGYCLEKLGHIDKAKFAYKKAIEIEPKAYDAYNNLAFLYLSSGKELDKALILSKKAYKLKPDSPSIMDTYAFALFKNGQTAESLNIYQELLPISPGNPTVYYHLGLVLEASGEIDEAKKALKNAITVDPSFTIAMKALERIHSKKINKKPEKPKIKISSTVNERKINTIVSSKKVISWRENSFKEEYEKGMNYFRDLKYDEALNTWKMAIFWFEENGEISPYIYKSINYLGLIKQTLKDFESAKYYYRLSELMTACFYANIVKKFYDTGKYNSAYNELMKLSQKLPKSLRHMLEHKEKTLNLKLYAQKHGEEISFVKKDNFRDYSYYSFRDINDRPEAEAMVRYARSEDFTRALSTANKIKQYYPKDPDFIIDYAQLLALNNMTKESMQLLDSYACGFFKKNWELYLLLKTQLFLF